MALIGQPKADAHTLGLPLHLYGAHHNEMLLPSQPEEEKVQAEMLMRRFLSLPLCKLSFLLAAHRFWPLSPTHLSSLCPPCTRSPLLAPFGSLSTPNKTSFCVWIRIFQKISKSSTLLIEFNTIVKHAGGFQPSSVTHRMDQLMTEWLCAR